MRLALLYAVGFCAGLAGAGERINQEGRILGPAPVVSAPTLFNTPQADALVSAMQIFPVTSAWNEDVSKLPVLGNSGAMLARIVADLGGGIVQLRPFFEMNYVLAPDSQPLVAINFNLYPGDSDPSPWPIPATMPIEGWPVETGILTNDQWQQDVNNDGGDRHSIIAMLGAGFLWETWMAKRVGSNWEAANGAKFDLKSNTLRPDGWTSGDAAGFPMFPALVRYDECQRGMVEHAVRLIVQHTRAAHIYPATHDASAPSTNDPDTPAMGQRLRLKAAYAIPAAWSLQAKAVALALKKYGGLVADNGNFFSMSVCPDDRFPAGCFDDLRQLSPGDFDVIQTTGPSEGPRSPGAPTADAGSDQNVALAAGATLNGTVTGTGAAVQWYVYSGPGAVTFGNSAAAATSASFSALGAYTLMLKADDGVHAVAYDAVVIEVSESGGPPGGGGGSDSDGDGVDDEAEIAAGTDPFSAASVPVVLALTVTKLKGTLNFLTAARDAVAVTGLLPDVPAGFDPLDASATLNVGGASLTLPLNAKGKGKSAAGSFALRYKKTKDRATGLSSFLGGPLPLKAKLVKGDFDSAWSNEGCTAGTAPTGAAAVFYVTFTLPGRIYAATVNSTYVSKSPKNGRFFIPKP